MSNDRSAGLLVLVLLGVANGDEADESPVVPGDSWERVSPDEAGMDAALLARAEKYALSGGGAGCIVRGGRIVAAWGDQSERYDLKSTTKSIGFTAVGLAIADGKLSLDDRAVDRHPSFGTSPTAKEVSQANRESGWLPRVTLRHLATQTAGFEKPGGYGRLLFEPGTRWHYSDAGPNWLAECVTLAYRRDVSELLHERVFEPVGIGRDDLVWRNNAYRPHEIDGIPRREFGSGVRANVDAMARLGLLYLRGGRWGERRLLPAEFVASVGRPVREFDDVPPHGEEHHGNAAPHYGLLWWNNADGSLANLPRDAYWTWGLYDSLIVVVPSLDLVVARAGKGWNRNGFDGHHEVLEPFLEPIAMSVRDETTRFDAVRNSPYPPSPVFRGIEWAPAESIVRRAEGGDNWPMTWADDDRQYTAYGDGRGFRPLVERKLSTGLAVVTGSAADFTAENLRSKTFERIGQGANGEKCCSLLAIDGVLYAWMRNADNSRLGWSKDRGQTWEWADWRFETSFGYPIFLQLGRDHEPGRELPEEFERFVYVYSHDSDSAYEGADRVVLARVPRDRIADRSEYRFVVGWHGDEPVWGEDIAQWVGVFDLPKLCYRGSVALHPATGRFLYVQIRKGGDTRFEGGFGIYDAPAPWGPWTTVFATDRWDVGPGETACVPIKWQSADGHDVHLVFSGDDAFSVRRATLTFPAPSRAAR